VRTFTRSLSSPLPIPGFTRASRRLNR
jgi:hypothetical protein